MLTAKTRNILIISILLLIVSGVVFVYGVYKVHDLGTVLKEQSAVIAANNALRQKHTELQSILKQTRSEREVLSGFLLTEDQTVQFLTEIEQLSRRLNVRLTTDSLSVVPKTSPSGFDKLAVKVSVEGSESNIRNLLRTFEHLPYHGRVTGLSLIKKNVNSGTAGFSGKIDLELSLRSP